MPSSQRIGDTINDILSRREFGYGNSLADEALDDLGDGLGKVFNKAVSIDSMPVAIIVIAGMAMLCLVIFIISRYMRDKQIKNAPVTGDVPENMGDPLEAAMSFAAAGDYEGAIVSLFVLHLSMLGDTGWIAPAKGKTSLQYEWELESCGYGDVEAFREFRYLFDSLRYGGYSAGDESFSSWLSYVRKPLPGRSLA